MEIEDNGIGDVIEGEDHVDTWSFFGGVMPSSSILGKYRKK